MLPCTLHKPLNMPDGLSSKLMFLYLQHQQVLLSQYALHFHEYILHILLNCYNRCSDDHSYDHKTCNSMNHCVHAHINFHIPAQLLRYPVPKQHCLQLLVPLYLLSVLYRQLYSLLPAQQSGKDLRPYTV